MSIESLVNAIFFELWQVLTIFVDFFCFFLSSNLLSRRQNGELGQILKVDEAYFPGHVRD